MKEVFYSYQMSQQKKTPGQIRLGIVAGEWQQIDLDTAASIGVAPKSPVRKSPTQTSKKSTS